MKSPLLVVRNLHHRFVLRPPWTLSKNYIEALRNVSFDLSRGHALGIVGESGSGKSTLARILAGLLMPDSGDVLLGGEPVSGLVRVDRKRLYRTMQMVFQNPASSLNPRKKVGATLAQPMEALLGLDKYECATRIASLLEKLGLPEEFANRYPHELSGGQVQRVAIGRALAAEPKLLVLDEPVSSLDPIARSGIIETVNMARVQMELAVVFISHDIGSILRIADTVAVMHNGQVVETGGADEVTRDPRNEYTKVLMEAARAVAMQTERPT